MDKNSVRDAVLCFEIAVIKELYKKEKIGEQEYMKAIKKLEKEKETLIVDANLIPAVLDLKI